MKKIAILLLLCLLLCGCAAEPVEETTLPTETQPTDYVEPTGIYDEGSPIEAATGGAVRSYPLNMEMVNHMQTMGDSVLVFSGTEGTTLTCLSGENLYIRGQFELPCLLNAAASTQVTEKGISYLDPETREMVFLDVSLKEVKRFAVPEDLVGDPIMSPDRQTMYYCTADAIRAMDLETGIKRLLKQIAYPTQTLEEILVNGTVLQCGVGDEAGNWELLFIDTQTGETLVRTRENITVASQDSLWYATVTEGGYRSMIFGGGDREVAQLNPLDITASGWYLPAQNAAVTASGVQDVTLSRYDLESGLITASVKLEGYSSPWCVQAGTQDDHIWLLSSDSQTGQAVIHRWDTAKTPVTDETVYTGVRYTENAPDTQSLESLQEIACALGERFGVEILIGSEAIAEQPWDYALETEYSAPVIRRQLEELEEVLSWYPADFFTKAAATTESGKLKICIVRSLTGTPESGLLTSVRGTQFWNEREAYLVVAAGEDIQNTFCHEVLHAADTLVFAKSKLFDDWDWLNPEGFEYDMDYIANQSRDGSPYLKEDNRAFIDTYSMSFPNEDRARIMEYAMMEGNEAYFKSEIMQEKLLVLSKAIREAFGWKKSEETFRWEQYLNESLAYKKK